MFEGDLYDKEELIRMACGHQGRHPYNFLARISPSRPQHYLQVREKLDKFLNPNGRWRKAAKVLFEGVSHNDDISISIYNPLSFFGMLLDIARKGSSSRVPSLKFVIKKQDGTEHIYSGALYWTRNINFLSPARAVKRTYPDLDIFYIRTVAHQLNSYDEKLSELYGLTYEVTREIDGRVERLVFDETAPEWVPFLRPRDLQTFVNQNSKLIGDVARFYKSLGYTL